MSVLVGVNQECCLYVSVSIVFFFKYTQVHIKEISKYYDQVDALILYPIFVYYSVTVIDRSCEMLY